MDINARNKLAKHHEQFIVQNFLENDVIAFFMLIREYLPKRPNKLREICDFIAHRERDKGDTQDFAVKYYDSMIVKTSTRKDVYEWTEDVERYSLSTDELYTELNSFLTKYDLPILSVDITNEIVMFLIGYFQDICFTRSKKDSTQICKFNIIICDTKILLCLHFNFPESKIGVSATGVQFLSAKHNNIPKNIFIPDVRNFELFRDEDNELRCKFITSASKVKNVIWAKDE